MKAFSNCCECRVYVSAFPFHKIEKNLFWLHSLLQGCKLSWENWKLYDFMELVWKRSYSSNISELTGVEDVGEMKKSKNSSKTCKIIYFNKIHVKTSKTIKNGWKSRVAFVMTSNILRNQGIKWHKHFPHQNLSNHGRIFIKINFTLQSVPTQFTASSCTSGKLEIAICWMQSHFNLNPINGHIQLRYHEFMHVYLRKWDEKEINKTPKTTDHELEVSLDRDKKREASS